MQCLSQSHRMNLNGLLCEGIETNSSSNDIVKKGLLYSLRENARVWSKQCSADSVNTPSQGILFSRFHAWVVHATVSVMRHITSLRRSRWQGAWSGPKPQIELLQSNQKTGTRNHARYVQVSLLWWPGGTMLFPCLISTVFVLEGGCHWIAWSFGNVQFTLVLQRCNQNISV